MHPVVPAPLRSHTVVPSPIGPITLVAEDGHLVALWMQAYRHAPDGHGFGEPDPDAEPLPAAARQLTEYFAGGRTAFDLPLAPAGTDFQRRVWAALRAIPYGETCSYGELAERIGSPGAARAVGLANGRNPIGIVVPCHRVVGSTGKLVGFGAGVERKLVLLDLERRVAGRPDVAPTLFDEPVAGRRVRRG